MGHPESNHCKCKKDGLVNYTGLAMVHGTERELEAFLRAEQTKLFTGQACQIATNHNKDTGFKPHGVSVPVLSGDDIRVTFGDTIISIESLKQTPTMTRWLKKSCRRLQPSYEAARLWALYSMGKGKNTEIECNVSIFDGYIMIEDARKEMVS